MKRAAHNHRHRRIFRHRRLLRAGAEARRLARLRHGAQAAGHRSARGRRASRPSISTIASRQSIEALVAAVLERTGGTLDALYNNGAYAQAGAVEDLPVEALREQFEANLFGWHDLTRRIVPVMRRAGPWPHRPLLVDPRPDAGPLARRLCRLEACAGRADAVPCAMELAGFRHPCLADRAGAGRIARSPPTASPGSSATSIMRIRCTATPIRRSSPACCGGGSKSRLKLKPDAVYAVLRHALLSRAPASALCGDLAGKDRRRS